MNGIIPFGNKDVAAIRDLVTDCIYKTSPYERGLLNAGEEVQIDLEGDLRRGEVIYGNLTKRIFCTDEGCVGGGPLERELYDCVPMPSLEISTGPNPAEEKKYDDALRALAVGLIDLTKNNDACSIIRQQCEQQFDGDYNSLFRDLDMIAELDLFDEVKAAQKKYKHLMPNGHGGIN